MTGSTPDPWEPYRPTLDQPWNLRRVAHLHRRAGLGASWSVLQRDLELGADESIRRFLQGAIAARDVPEDFDEIQELIGNAAASAEDIHRLKAWWAYRMMHTPDPLTERLTLMWHNHFATSNVKVDDVALMKQQNDRIRVHARGPFAELLAATVQDPAMLVWLDADANRQEHANENLARELLELFTLGEGNYHETDVRETARALTGWTVRSGQFLNLAQHHDPGVKTVLGVSGNWKGDDVLQIAADHPATSKRVAWRLCDEFFSPGVVQPEHIIALAERYLGKGQTIQNGVETILRSKLFFTDENISTKILSPVPWAIGILRSLERHVPPPSTLLLAEWFARMGQDLFYPPSVFGWPSDRAWLTESRLVARQNYCAALVQGRTHRPQHRMDTLALARRHGHSVADQGRAFYSKLLFQRESQSPFTGTVPSAVDHVINLVCSPEMQLG